MSQKNIDFGNYPDDPDADSIRSAFQKVQDNFNQLFAPVGAESAVTSVNRTPGAGITVSAPTGNIVISANIACVQVHTNTLSIGRGTNGLSDTSITSSSQVLWVDLPESITNVGNITVTGNITANKFIGDGSLLTGISGGASLGNLTASNVTLSANTATWPVNISASTTGANYWYNAYGGNILIDAYTDFYMYAQGVTTDSGGNVFTIGGNDGDFGIPYVTKHNANGTLAWAKTVTSNSNKWFYGKSLMSDSTGNIVLTIENEEDNLNGYQNIVKIDTTGAIVLQKAPQLSTPYSGGYVRLLSTVDSADNIYVVIGSPEYSSPYSENGFNIIKYNSAGTVQWQKRIDAYSTGQAFGNINWKSIQVDPSDNVYVLGDYMAAVRQVVLYKINSAGTTFDYASMPALEGGSLSFDPSGNIYFCGAYIDYSDTSTPILGCVIKYTSSLGQVWGTKFVNNPFPGYWSSMFGIKYDNGTLYTVGNGDDIVVMALDSTTGAVLWKNVFTTAATNVNATVYIGYTNDYSTMIDVTSDSIILPGVTDSQNIGDMLTIKIPKDGSGIGQSSYYVYIPFDAAVDSLVSSSSWSAATTNDSITISDSATYAVSSTATYSNYTTSIRPAETKQWQFNGANGLVFPDGSSQPTAFNPYDPTTIYNLSVSGNFVLDQTTIALGKAAIPSAGGVAIGSYAGANRSKARTNTVAIGPNAQRYGNGDFSVAIGSGAGQTSRGSAVAIGPDSGSSDQGNLAVSIGGQAGLTSQRDQAVAIGYNAGYQYQGNAAVAIGALAGYNSQNNNSIVINATGSALNSPAANTLTIKPIRNASAGNVLYYDSSTGEVTYSTGGGGGSSNSIPQVTWTGTTRTVQLTDPGSYLYTTEASNKTLYIPTNAETAIPVNSVLNVLIKSANSVTVTANAGVTLYMVGSSTTGNRTINGYGMATLLKTETNVWFISGTGVY